MLLLLLLIPFLGAIDLQPEVSSGYEAKEPAIGKTMMVASANPYASEIGYAVLEKGGNAIDAAIAIQMALTVAEPQSSGIGGGGFLLYYSKKEGEVIAYDGRETAPKNVETTRLPSIVGGKSVGTPGVLKMLALAHSEHGSLPWKDLFTGAIELSKKGFPVSQRLRKNIESTPALTSFAETRSYFFENGKLKRELKNPLLADTLQTIANEGITPFYEGEIAEAIVKAVRPGKLSLEDLADYRPVKRKPIEIEYRGYRVFGFPPPSSGGIAVAQILGMLSQENLQSYSLGKPAFIDLFCRASRAAYVDRQQYGGDPAFTNIPIQHLLNPTYLKNRLKSPGKAAYAALELPSTSQICVVDKEGNAVSFTTSIEHSFGSSIMVRGFFLNNELTDFSSGPNRIEPGKRPMSAMSPTLIFHGDQLVLNVGSAGGSRIIDYVSKALLGVLDFGLNIQEAIAFPNYTSLSETIDLEKDTFLEEDVQKLEQMGNTVRVIPLTSGSQGIQITSEGLIGGVDPRRDGLAIGD